LAVRRAEAGPYRPLSLNASLDETIVSRDAPSGKGHESESKMGAAFQGDSITWLF